MRPTYGSHVRGMTVFETVECNVEHCNIEGGSQRVLLEQIIVESIALIGEGLLMEVDKGRS